MKEIQVLVSTIVDGINVADKERFKAQLLEDRTRVPERRLVIALLQQLLLIDSIFHEDAFYSSRMDPKSSDQVIVVYDDTKLK